ncbi:MAG: hypothetical protein NUV57_00910 [archaeon]|nr:hypothetical protein [archaeon]
MQRRGESPGRKRKRQVIKYGASKLTSLRREQCADSAHSFLNSLFGSAEIMFVNVKGARLPLREALQNFSEEQQEHFYFQLHLGFLKVFGKPKLKVTENNVEDVLERVYSIVNQELAEFHD